MALADAANSSSTSRSRGSFPSSRPEQNCSSLLVAINLFRLLTITEAVLPQTAARRAFLNVAPCSGQTPNAASAGHRINEYRHLLNRVEENSWITVRGKGARRERDDQHRRFQQTDLRVAKIRAPSARGADKLLKLTLDMAMHAQVIAGIKSPMLRRSRRPADGVWANLRRAK